MSRTLILVKPDAFDRALTGEVLARFERKGLRIKALKLLQPDEAIANEHYAEHTEKPFFGELVSFITGGPLVAAIFEGHEAVAAAQLLGPGVLDVEGDAEARQQVAALRRARGEYDSQPSSGNQIPISRSADSSESEPWTMLKVTSRA